MDFVIGNTTKAQFNIKNPAEVFFILFSLVIIGSICITILSKL